MDHDARATVSIRVAGDVIGRRRGSGARALELALDRLEVRVALDPDVRGAVEVVLEAGEGDFLRDGSAADRGIALDRRRSRGPRARASPRRRARSRRHRL